MVQFSPRAECQLDPQPLYDLHSLFTQGIQLPLVEGVVSPTLEHNADWPELNSIHSCGH